jgi:capsular exopolysaccharide synthesis family protein
VARLIDNAAVGSAVGPHKKLNLIIGLLVGLVVGTGIARIVESLDRTLKTPVQATELFKAPLLGVVPRAKRDGLLPSTIADDPRSQAGEAYRSLRTAVRFVNPDRPLRTLLVTSPTAKDGKTTTAANLALALAQSGERVVLVDADLRRSRVADLMGVPGDLGVSSIVTRQADFEHCVVGWRDLLAVVAAGPLPPNPSELLGSQAMRDLIGHLGQFADVAVFDAPPILPVTDAVVLATQLDGVLLVARSGKTLRTSAVEAVRRLDAVGANVVGCVLNGVSGFTSGGYYEDYRYLARRPARTRFGRRATDVVSA